MSRHVRVAFIVLTSPRLLPHIAVLLASRNRVIEADLKRWAEVLDWPAPRTKRALVWTFLELMTFWPEYRNVFYLRLGGMRHAIGWLCPRLSSLQIAQGDVGPGLFIQHGLATLVSAHKIGANCWINQGVSIGFANNRTDRPTIGDNVRISAGAKIIGNVTIGDNVIIGANTVVIGDVPANATVLGVPGKILWSTRPTE